MTYVRFNESTTGCSRRLVRPSVCVRPHVARKPSDMPNKRARRPQNWESSWQH